MMNDIEHGSRTGENSEMTKQDKNLRAEYPEIAAGGYSRVDGTLEFYLRINSLIAPNATVLDYGAGRGAQMTNPKKPFVAQFTKLQGKVRKIVGVDVDPAVLENPYLDEAKVIAPGKSLPFGDATFDLIYSDWVLEHVDTPQLFADEVFRLLKPDGWFCARTPNRWGMTGIGTNLIPNKLHAKLLKTLQPDRESRDVFPTTYKLNTRGRLRKIFTKDKWLDYSYSFLAEPPYIQGSRLLLGAGRRILNILPEMFGTNLYVFMRKR